MKNFRWTLVFGLVVAGLVAFTVYDYKRSNQVEEKKNEEAKIVPFKTDDVSRIEIRAKDAKIVMEKKDGKWKLLEPVQDSGDTQSILSLLASVEGEKVKETVVEGPDVAWTPYGLDQPVTAFKVTSNDGQTRELQIGSIKAYDGSLYGRLGDEKRVVLVSSNWDVQLSKPVREFRDKHLFRQDPAPAFDSIEIQVNETDQKSNVHLKKVDGKKWELVGAKDPYPVSEEAVNAYIDQVKSLRAVDFGEEKDGKGVLSKSGLAQPGLIVRLQEGEKNPFEIKAEAPPKKEGAEIGNLHVVSSDVQPVLSVYQSGLNGLKKREEDFYDKKLPFQFTVGEVGRVKIATPSVTAELVKEGDKWVPADKGLQKDVDSGRLNEMLGKLSKLEAIRFLQPIRKGQKPPSWKGESSIELSKASGEPVFDFAWGEAVVEKAAGGKPETRYLPARTTRVDRVIGVPEASVNDLALASILKEKPQPSPTPSATMTTSSAKADGTAKTKK